MKNLKKLSLEDEINREAEEIEKKVKENKEIAPKIRNYHPIHD